MIVPEPDWREIANVGPHWTGGSDPADEPWVECDACGVVVEWLPRADRYVEVDSARTHECQP